MKSNQLYFFFIYREKALNVTGNKGVEAAMEWYRFLD